jgi:guanine deaminase
VHYSQTAIVGAGGEQLIDWLNKYTFPTEKAFSDHEHALATARIFLEESLRSGTTTSTVFCTTDPVSVDAFFQASEERGMRNIAGKVIMDRNAPAELLDTAQTAFDDSQALIDRWHQRGRCLYAVSPRFAPTSTPEQMELTGALWQGNPGTYLQSHVSENLAEVAWAQELFPHSANYVDIYRKFGHLGERAIFGHGIHLSESELQLLHESGTAIAHCPTSNLFLGSGLFRLHDALRPERPVRVGLGSDIGAGTNFSPLVTMNEAYKVAQLNGQPLSAWQAFYLATRGAARALYLDDTIGSLQEGLEADMLVLDLQATPFLKYRLAQANSLEEMLFVLMTLGDDRATRATYVAGQPAYVRDEMHLTPERRESAVDRHR